MGKESSNIKLDEILSELESEKESLGRVLDTIDCFVSTYKEINGIFNDFYLENIDFPNDLKKLQDNMSIIGNKLDEYNNDVIPKYDDLSINIEVLHDEFNEIIKKYNSLDFYLTEIKQINDALNHINIEALNEKLENTVFMIDKLCETFKLNVEIVEILKDEMSFLCEESKKQNGDLKLLIKENRETNKLLNEMSKNNNIETAVLFELMDEWYRTKKSTKR